MLKINKTLLAFMAFMVFSLVFITIAHTDETDLFVNVPPDALIVLDLSGSMNWRPDGNPEAEYRVPCVGDRCSRLAIAKTVLFDVLDHNNNNVIDKADEESLNIRLGYMRFVEVDEQCTLERRSRYSFRTGCNTLIREIGTKYSLIYCNRSDRCFINTRGGRGSIGGEIARGGTPLAASLREAKLYLDFHKKEDPARACRQKFAILVSDGADTYACGGSGLENQITQYQRRRETVAAAKALSDAGYKVFVVGFGKNMPRCQRNTLNWAAYYGGTDNPTVDNSGNITAYNPANVISCQIDETRIIHDICGKGGRVGDTVAISNDPATADLSGYAFLAADANELTDALRQAFGIIGEATFSFTVASVSAARIKDENHIYEASFRPKPNASFWPGHLKKFSINDDGSVGSLIWDAGSVLKERPAANRNILTYKSGATVPFTTANITRRDLDVANDRMRDQVVGYIRGGEPHDNWKLGDIFRSNPITIGTPSIHFNDTLDRNNAFLEHRQNNKRTSDNNRRVIVAGTNAGQMHVFRASDGSEVMSFIPPNLLPRLKNIAEGLIHQPFVDGPITVADVWLGTGDGTAKSATDWKTLMVFGLGKGGSTTLWSSSPSCDSGFKNTYSSDHRYYCGYYAFDFTNTLNPAYMWRINPDLSDAPYLGEPWSRMAIGKVKIGGDEKWVGFIGGGYNASACGVGVCDRRGKGFFVVDLSDGDILWSYTRSDDARMNYSLPASPAILDINNDGFIDIAYIGDMGGNMWRFKVSDSNTADWRGRLLFDAQSGPIYTTPSAAKDAAGNLWVYWGTGDREDPTAVNVQEKFYAVKDDPTATYRIGDLKDITNNIYRGVKQGWYIRMTGRGEKILSDPTVFGGVVYFTTFTPSQTNNPCDISGKAKLYAVRAVTGGGVLSDPKGQTTRSIEIGVGIPSSPVISLKPGIGRTPDIYITVSGGTGRDVATTRVNFNPPFPGSRGDMLFWHDRRVQ